MMFEFTLDDSANGDGLHRIAQKITNHSDVSGFRQFHQHREIRSMIAMGAERFEDKSPGHRDAGIARAQILGGTIENRRYAALAGAVLNPQAGQSGEPCGLLCFVVELETVLGVVLRPIVRVRHRHRPPDKRVAAGMMSVDPPAGYGTISRIGRDG